MRFLSTCAAVFRGGVPAALRCFLEAAVSWRFDARVGWRRRLLLLLLLPLLLLLLRRGAMATTQVCRRETSFENKQLYFATR